MPRSARNSYLETRTARLKLVRGARLYVAIGKRLALGYRRTTDGFGTWQARIFSQSGKYRFFGLAAADDQQDANGVDVLDFYQAQERARSTYDDFVGGRVGSKGHTVADAITNYLVWFREERKAVRETESAIKAHITPIFGETPIERLQAKEIRNWHRALATHAVRRRSKKGARQRFGAKPHNEDQKRARRATANRVLTVLKAVLNKAIEDELVTDSSAWKNVKPFKNADLPRVRYLTEADSTRLINACEPDFRRLVRVALFTGARYGELTALTVSHFNPDTASVFIRPSKSGKARHVPLSRSGLDFLKSAVAGKAGDDLIFTKKDGTAWGKNHHVRELKIACTNAKIVPGIGFHELRHTYASLLAQAGADLLTISKLLGHADTRVTSRHYAHLCDRTLANAVNALLPSFGHISETRLRSRVRNERTLPPTDRSSRAHEG
jgi:integrase